jgi:hypothetical protein
MYSTTAATGQEWHRRRRGVRVPQLPLLTEVEGVCDRVAIVSQGRVVPSGPLDDLAGAVTQLRLLLDRSTPATRPATPPVPWG